MPEKDFVDMVNEWKNEFDSVVNRLITEGHDRKRAMEIAQGIMEESRNKNNQPIPLSEHEPKNRPSNILIG